MFRTKSNQSTASKASKLSKKEVKMQMQRDPQSGRPGHLDPGQEHQVKKFRQIVSWTSSSLSGQRVLLLAYD